MIINVEVATLSSNPWCSNTTQEPWNKPLVCPLGPCSRAPKTMEDHGCHWQAVSENRPVLLRVITNQLMPLVVSLPAESSTLYQKQMCFIETKMKHDWSRQQTLLLTNKRVQKQPDVYSNSRKFAGVWREFSSLPTFSCMYFGKEAPLLAAIALKRPPVPEKDTLGLSVCRAQGHHPSTSSRTVYCHTCLVCALRCASQYQKQ